MTSKWEMDIVFSRSIIAPRGGGACMEFASAARAHTVAGTWSIAGAQSDAAFFGAPL